MTVQNLFDIVLGLALVGFIAFRQTTWGYVDPARVWRMPLVLGVIGLVTLSQSHAKITTTDVVFFGIEALVTIGVGLVMGRLTTFRVAPQPNDKGLTIQARTGGWGAALWLVLIAVRVGLDVLGSAMGAELLASTGAILLALALNRAARAVVMDQRMPRSRRVGA
jgi:hypothetical protein